MIQKLKNNWIPLVLFGGSLGYYYALSSKIFTWIYTSGDAGDWLAQTNWWMVPQCYGKPLYITLIHALNYLPIADDVFRITFFLSVIPAAVMVAMTYLIAKHMTNSSKLALTAGLIVMGANIVLSQATVLEQYTMLGALFLTSYYFYLEDRKVLFLIFLGFTTATHIVGAVFAVMLLMIEWKNRREWVKFIPVYLACGALPYVLILYLMADPETPKLLAGNLSWGTINSWGGNSTSTAALALVEAPNRLREMAIVFLTAMGLAWIPLWKGFSKPWDTKMKFLIAVSAFSAWFYVTNLFPSTWKFMTPIIPLLACIAVLGLKKFPEWHYKAVTIGAIVLIVVNGFFFNTDKIAKADPQATEYIQKLEQLPDGACLVTPRGGQYGFSIFYQMSKGQELIPLATSDPNKWHEEQDSSYIDYTVWLNDNYGIEGRNIYELVTDALKKGHPVYFATPMTKMWDAAFEYEMNDEDILHPISGVRYNPDFPTTEITSGGGFLNTFGRVWQLRQTVVGEDK